MIVYVAFCPAISEPDRVLLIATSAFVTMAFVAVDISFAELESGVDVVTVAVLLTVPLALAGTE